MGVWAETLPLTLRKKLHSVGGVCMLSYLALGQLHRRRRVRKGVVLEKKFA